jgi:spore maturation protein CgeB
MVRQMLLGLQSAGADVFEYNTDENQEALDCEGRPYDRGTFGPVWLRWEIVGPAIERFQPELIVCNAGGLSFRPEVADSLRQSRSLMGIALSDPDVFAPSTSRIARNFDLFLTNAHSCLPAYRALGANAIELPLATNPDFFHPLPGIPELACDVLIIGRAHPDRIAPVRALCGQFRVHIYGEDWDRHDLPSRPPLYDDDLLRALNSARIAVIFGRTPAGHVIAKIAVLDFVAAGALVATEQTPALSRYFEYGREIIGFNNVNDLIESVRYYLDHPDEAEKIRLAGRRRVLEDHTWARLWPRMLAELPPKEKSIAK